MPKTKISEFSATPGNNTDIDGINIAEGCPPSGINDAIRELMAQLKDFQAGTAGDSFNGPVGTTTPAAGAFTNLSASGTFALTGDQVQISEGGTGQTTANAAFNALAPSQTSNAGKYLKTDGTNTSWDAIEINTADITGTLPIANGGTGLTALGTGVQTALGQNVTGSGGIVLASSPTLTTPNLGTPSAVTLTNATGLPLSTGVTGTLATTNGGTGLTSFTANGVVYASSSSALTTGSALTFDGTNLTLGGASFARATVIQSLSGTSAAFAISDNATTTMYANNVSSGVSALWSSGSLAFGVGSGNPFTEAMRLTSTGLGIGTSSPLARLDVQGGSIKVKGYNTLNFNDGYSLASGVTGSIGYIQSYYGNGSSVVGMPLTFDASYFAWRNIDASYAERMRLDSSGNLGIGVTPSAWGSAWRAFEMNGFGLMSNASNPGMYLMGNAYYNGTNYIYKATAAASNYTQTAGEHKWFTAPSGTAGNAISFTQAMTLDASGNLGIGTSSPVDPLTVNGTIASRTNINSTVNILGVNSSAGSSAQMRLRLATDTVTANYGILSSGYAKPLLYLGTESNHPVAFLVNNTQRMELDTSGNLGLGVTPSAWNSAYTAFDIKRGSVFQNSASNWVGLANNAYNNGTNWIYKESTVPRIFRIQNDQFEWLTAPSGTAGNAISFTQAMTLDASGRLLVGTTSTTNIGSDDKLRVFGNGNGVELGGSSSTGIVRVRGSDSGAALLDFTKLSTNPDSSPFFQGRIFYSFASDYMSFATGSTERARIDSSGRLLVGTTAKGAYGGNTAEFRGANIATLGTNDTGNLTIFTTDSQAADVGAVLSLGGVYAGTTPYAFGAIAARKSNSTSGNAEGYLQFYTTSSSNAIVERARITSGGQFAVVGAGSASAPTISKTDDLNTGIFFPAADTIAFAEGGVESMRVDSSGRLLVGMTSTDITSGGVRIVPADGGTGVSAVSIGHSSSGGSGSFYSSFHYSGTVIGSITQNGTTAIAYNTTSDYRLKSNPQPLTGSGAFIDALKPKTWNWTADGTKGVGFIAHEVQEVSPNSVVGTKDAVDEEGKPVYQAMEYGSAEFIANIIAELQSLRQRVAALEAK